jgi:hypothetical protein
VLVTGALIAAAGLMVFTQISPDGTLLWSISAPSVVVAVGFAIIVVPTTIAALTGVPAAHAGIASALLNVSLQVGGALGLAVLSTAATTRTTSRLQAGGPPDAALVDGFGLAFRIAAALMVLTAVLTVLLFGDQGRGQKVDHAEITQRQRQQ